MATHHSKTGRAKSTDDQIVVPSWDEVWRSFDKENQLTTVEEMNAEGWRSIQQVVQSSGLSDSRVRNMVMEGKFECEKRKVKQNGVAKTINFVRPIVQ
jgi:hypothetical protein